MNDKTQQVVLDELLNEVAVRRKVCGVPVLSRGQLDAGDNLFEKLEELQDRFKKAAALPNPEPAIQNLADEISTMPLGATAGLAFSGGGVRSASVGLGFYQGLAEDSISKESSQLNRGLLRQIDYLSTVSGGGYAGSLITALATDVANKQGTCRDALERITPGLPKQEDTPSPPGTPQPLWERILHRGQMMNQLGSFLGRHLASTLLFNVMLLCGLLWVGLTVVLLWRFLDQSPLHEFLWWISDRHLPESKRPFLISAALLYCWLLIALSQRDCQVYMRVLGLAVPLAIFTFLLGYPYLLFTTISLAVTCLVLANYHRVRFRYTVIITVVCTLPILVLVVLQILLATDMVPYPVHLLLAFVATIVQTVHASWLSMSLDKQQHRRMTTGFLLFLGASVVIGCAVWLSTPNMNFSRSSRPDNLFTFQKAIQPILAIVTALILPFIRPRSLFQSGLPNATPTKKLLFNLASSALLIGVPFVTIYFLAFHNFAGTVSSYERRMNRYDTVHYNEPRLYYQFLLDQQPVMFSFIGMPIIIPKPGMGEILTPASVAMVQVRSHKKLSEFMEAISSKPTRLQKNKFWNLQPLSTWADESKMIVRDPELVASVLSDVIEQKQFCVTLLNDGKFKKAINSKVKNTIRDLKKKEKDPGLSALEMAKLQVNEALKEELDRYQLYQQLVKANESEKAESYIPKWHSFGNMLYNVYHSEHTIPLGFVRRASAVTDDQSLRGILWVVLAVAFLLCAWLLDLNWTSAQHFYRRQLELAYLRLEGEEPREIRLADTNTTQLGLPYHLINGAVDYTDKAQEPDTILKPYLFSRRYCGNAEIGFQQTGKYQASRPLRLADAMAISGAAVHPIRIDQNWLLRTILTVMNLRLGQWLEHPSSKVSLRYVNLLNMLTSTYQSCLPPWRRRSTTAEACNMVFVADGGYYENLGIESLLARKCKLIIAVDASADPNYQFEDLCRLINRVRFQGTSFKLLPGLTRDAATSKDKAIRSNGTFHLDAVTPCEKETAQLEELLHKEADNTLKQRLEPYCPSHFVFASIRYGEEVKEQGLLVYVKLSMTGDENDLKLYQRRSNEFPHHPTSEQLFPPEMVNAYRRLGRHLARELSRTMRRWLGDGKNLDTHNLTVDDIVAALSKVETTLTPESADRTGAPAVDPAPHEMEDCDEPAVTPEKPKEHQVTPQVDRLAEVAHQLEEMQTQLRQVLGGIRELGEKAPKQRRSRKRDVSKDTPPTTSP
jgi:predicted acylesterase/phospholipase RssA